MRRKTLICCLVLFSIIAGLTGCVKKKDSPAGAPVTHESDKKYVDPLKAVEEGRIGGIGFKLGAGQKEVVEILGKPEKTGTVGGSELLRYRDTYYYFDLTQKKLIGIGVSGQGKEILNVKTGMRPEEIKLALGKPDSEFYNDHEDRWNIVYKRGSNELYFMSRDKNSPTDYVLLLKKD